MTIWRFAALVVLVAATPIAVLSSAAGAVGDQSPIPLTASRGYTDYCEGMNLHRQGRVCGRGRVLRRLWRPLTLPTVAPGDPCPVSPRHSISRNVKGVGPGPIYSTHVIPWLVPFPAPENSVAAGTGWSVDKTPLVWKKRFRGAFLIRGARIDEPGALGFSGPAGRRPFAAMQFAAGRSGLEVSGLHGWPIVVWMTTPGCYAFQIDTKIVSRLIVFRIQPLTG